jgi:large subunit ribosomal protein L29
VAEIERIADFEMQVGSWYWVRPERRATMEVEKIRNLSDEELALEGRKAAEQLFRLRFQMRLGQTEGVKKLRDLKKDVARISTIARERELGLHTTAVSSKPAKAGTAEETHAEEHSAKHAAAKKKTVKPAKKSGKKAVAARKSGGHAAAGRKSSAARPSASKKQATRSSSVKRGS